MRLWEAIEAARRSMEDVILRTPMIYSDTFSKLTGKEVFLKLENLQKTGSFKVRGAYNKIVHLGPDEKRKGVVAASAGNHAQGVAFASSLLGIRATIVMPQAASLAKQMATRAYGGEVLLFGQNTDEALARAQALAQEGRSFIHPFDDDEVIAGQGTIGLEILEDLPEVEAIIVPVGGGGLIAGISTIVRKRRPSVEVIGVEASNAQPALVSLRRKRVVEVPIKPTLADGIALRKVGERTFPVIQKNVSEILTVREDEIASAILLLMERKRILAEGAGAAPLAALLSGRWKGKAKRIVLVISGGNIDIHLLDRILEKGLARTGRLLRLEVLLRDVPGALAELTSLVARNQANILHIFHERTARDVPLGFSKVVLTVETRGLDHIRQVQKGLKDYGYEMKRLV
jgi:threonine dehydratase